MDNVNLVTYPDFVSSGFQVVLINVDAEQQVYIGNLLLDFGFPSNIYQLDLEVHDHLSYNLQTLAAADLILFNRPNMWHWTTGLVLGKAQCFFIETDGATVNTFKKLSLRHVKIESLAGIIKNALQRKQQQQADM